MKSARAVRLAFGILVTLFGLCAVLFPVSAATYRADSVKAAFLYRFTGYVDWPAQALSQPMFTIAVLGSDTVAEELGPILSGRSIKNLPAKARSIQAIDEIADAQLLYVGPDYNGNLRSIVEALAGQPVLVVTDNERGLNEGSVVNFLLVDQRVRFEVSLPAAAKLGLKLDPALLSVATRVLGSPRSELPCMPVMPPQAEDWMCLSRLASL